MELVQRGRRGTLRFLQILPRGAESVRNKEAQSHSSEFLTRNAEEDSRFLAKKEKRRTLGKIGKSGAVMEDQSFAWTSS